MPTIVDIDGTLLRNGTTPIQKVIDYVNALHGSILIVTGRPRSDRSKTIAALKAAGLRYTRLIMSPYSPTQTLKHKAEQAKKLAGIAKLAIDNDPEARKIYQEAGIRTKDPARI